MEPDLNDDAPHTVPVRTLREFAGLWIVVFGGFAAWELWHDKLIVGSMLAVLAAVVGPLGLARPETIRPIFLGWMALAVPIRWMVSHVLVACLFYVVLTPVGLFFKLIGRDALHRRLRPGQATYWTAKPRANNPRRYFHQF